MKVEVKGSKLFVEMDIAEQVSKSGKSMVIATTSGNKPTEIKYKGETLIVGINAYIPKR